MNLKHALAQARKVLKDSGIENPELEGEILLRHALKKTRAELFSDMDGILNSSEHEKLSGLLERRQTGEPSAYIIGYKEFYNLLFKVDRRVLIPRPETELLVEQALSYCKQYGYSTIADIGTGSGCIAISLARNLPGADIFASDASLPALEVGEENALAHKVKGRIKFLWGDLLTPLPCSVDMIVANLPYVKKDEISSRFEPVRALDGGNDGLDKIRELCGMVKGKLKPCGSLLLEVGQGQAEAVYNNLHNIYPSSVIKISKDLAGIDRVICMRLTS